MAIPDMKEIFFGKAGPTSEGKQFLKDVKEAGEIAKAQRAENEALKKLRLAQAEDKKATPTMISKAVDALKKGGKSAWEFTKTNKLPIGITAGAALAAGLGAYALRKKRAKEQNKED